MSTFWIAILVLGGLAATRGFGTLIKQKLKMEKK